jgi:hypothetical protein
MKGVYLIILLFFLFFKSYSQQLPGIYFDDINNFWKSYEQYLQCNSDSCVQTVVKNGYLPNSSKCYKELLSEKRFDVSAVSQFWKYPLFLASLKSWSQQLYTLKDSILFYCNKAQQLYGGSSLNDIYFMISSWNQGGTVVPSGLSIGIQYFCGYDSLNVSEIGKIKAGNISPRDKLIPVIIHEQIHKWRKYENTQYVYEACMREGNCDFAAYMITGQIVASKERWVYFETIKDSITTIFKKEYKEKRNANDWVSIESKKFDFGAAGYYIGFKICEAFYKRAKNKTKAMRQIIEMKDAEQILKQSHFLLNSKN